MLLVTGKRWRRCMRVWTWLEGLNVSAFFWVLQYNTCFSHILFTFHNNNKSARWLRWLMRWLAGTGTWVRFPGPLIYFIIFTLTCSSVALIQRNTMHPNACACQVSQRINPMARTWIPPCTLVNPSTHNSWKSKKALFLGQKCFKHTSKKGQTPPWFAYFCFLF